VYVGKYIVVSSTGFWIPTRPRFESS